MQIAASKVDPGFTLVEMVTVIAITAIVATATAVFLRLPLQQYQDAQRRAAITDAADTAFTRIKRDLQTALPNSVRVRNVGAVFYLEFLPTITGGRYRSAAPSTIPPTGVNTCPDVAAPIGFADENVLEFGVSDSCFTTLGDLPNRASVTVNHFVVVYNLGSGFTNADAYVGGNRSQISAAVAAGAGGVENVVRFNPRIFNLESPGRRFQIVSDAVSYVCDPSLGVGTLSRVTGYGIVDPQPTPAGGDRLAQNITQCTITYDVINQRVGIVSIWLTLTDADVNATAVNLFQQVQVGNVP